MREVKIVTKGRVHFVEYCSRKKGGRYLAAQFDATSKTIESVIKWVSDNNLKLTSTETV